MKKLLVSLFVFGFLLIGSQVHAANSCTDSDGGVDNYTKGFTQGDLSGFGDGYDGTTGQVYDFCIQLDEGGNYPWVGELNNSNIWNRHEVQNCQENCAIYEMSCLSSGEIYTEASKCSNGCSNGACIPSPSITILSPNGGEVYQAGQQITVKWESSNYSSSLPINISIGYSDSSIGFMGTYIETLATTTNTGSQVVNLPTFRDPFGIGTHYKIFVSNSSDPLSATLVDSSNNLFTIKSTTPSITVLTPNGRDMYEVGQQINVTWDSTGIPASSNNIDITLHGYNANGVIVWSKELSSFTYNDGQEKVVLPTNLGGVPFGKNFVISVGTDSTNNPSPISDFSDTTFTIGKATDVTNGGCSNGEVYSSTSDQKCSGITTPSITVLSPNEGEIYQEGDTARIKWTSNNLPSNYRIQLYFNYSEDLKDEYKQSVLITKANDKGYYDYKLPMFSQYKKTNYPLPGKNYEFTAYLFDSSLFNTPSSNAVAIGSSAHGSNDGFFTINILNTFTPDTSCSAGAIYSSVTGKKCFEKDEVRDTGCIAGYNYSSTTGKPCALGLYKKDNTNVLNPITSSITRTLKRGIKGDDVKILQLFLNLAADGSFGPQTQAKVIEWQMSNGLTPDGAFGRMSREKAGMNQ